MVKKIISVKVLRFDPSTDRQPYYGTYEVPWKDGMTVLEALRYIYENQGAVAFRYGCKSGMCGTCSVKINGKPALACTTFIKPGQTVIEPLGGFPIIRDLVVDRDQMAKRTLAIQPWVQRVNPPTEEPERIQGAKLAEFFKFTLCRECYCCYASCPIIQVAGWEEFGGPKIFTRDIALRVFDPRDDAELRLKVAVHEGLYNCTTCRACVEACPREIPITDEVFEGLRARAVEEGFGPLPGHMEFLNSIRKIGKAVPKTTPSLLEQVPEVVEVPNPVDEVVFFTGCLIDYRLQKVGLGIIEVLKRNRVKTFIPRQQTCCASTAFRTGRLDIAVEQVRRNIEVLESYHPVSKVVVACAGCGLTLKRNFPEVMIKLRDEKPRFEVYEVTEYLMNILGVERMNKKIGEVKLQATYHDPCHLARGQGIRTEPREVMAMIPGLNLVEMEGADVCCGAGGGVRSGVRPLSVAIGSKKAESIMKAGVDVCITECPFCYIQIRDMLQMTGCNVKVCYLIDLLADAYVRSV